MLEGQGPAARTWTWLAERAPNTVCQLGAPELAALGLTCRWEAQRPQTGFYHRRRSIQTGHNIRLAEATGSQMVRRLAILLSATSTRHARRQALQRTRRPAIFTRRSAGARRFSLPATGTAQLPAARLLTTAGRTDQMCPEARVRASEERGRPTTGGKWQLVLW